MSAAAKVFSSKHLRHLIMSKKRQMEEAELLERLDQTRREKRRREKKR